MLKLEKVFQNDDHIFINLYILINSLFVFFSIYTFSILENNSFFYFFNYKIFKESSFYEFSFLVTFIFLFHNFFFHLKKDTITLTYIFLKLPSFIFFHHMF